MRCDEEMFVQMYEGVYRELFRYAFCVLGQHQDAEDAVSEAVMSAYANIRKLRKPEAFKGWMFTILANVCKKRRKSMAREVHGREESGWQALSSREVDHAEALDVRRAFDILSEEEKEIIGLSVFGGYSSREIGDMLDQNASTVRSRRSRALKKMEVMLR